jgi:hypothetical protein
MKSNFSHIGLAKLCGWFGITRQAYYQHNWEGIPIHRKVAVKCFNQALSLHQADLVQVDPPAGGCSEIP